MGILIMLLQIHPEAIQSTLYFGSFASLEVPSAIVICDKRFASTAGLKLAKKLNAPLLAIVGGENAKTIRQKNQIEQFLFKHKCDPKTTLIALGGGTITDVVAFTASTYLRGIPLILIPTTLLAMVDAAIGGKTAINSRFRKNLFGTFYLPQKVVIDLDFLSSLPQEEKLNGYAEILKMGLIVDAPACLNINDPEAILQAIQAKINIVEQDPFDRGIRKILNFGHTIGHALEALSHYQIPHGQAVAFGSLLESHLSMHLGFLRPKDFQTIQNLYRSFSFSLPPQYTQKKLLQFMMKGNSLSCVLIDRIGHAMEFSKTYRRLLTPDEVKATLIWAENHFPVNPQSVHNVCY